MIVISILFLLNAGCKNNSQQSTEVPAQKETITISGAWALYPMMVKWVEEFKKIHPDLQIDLSAGGAGKGITDALTGVADIGMVSRDLKEEEITKGAMQFPVVKDAVIPTVNENNPIIDKILGAGITREQLVDIWITEKIKKWSDIPEFKTANSAINVYTRSDACGAAETWAKYLGKKQEDLKGTAVYGDPGIAETVRKDNFGIGYNNINFAYDQSTKTPVKGLKILPLDLNNNRKIDADEKFYDNLDSLLKAILDGKYPSPPARNLFLVSNGLPKKAIVTEFFKWILTEGQKFVEVSGYIKVQDELLKEDIDKLSKIK
ncbi:substrate-binding domain-containing protein [Candidatus Dependentiae bacterium]|nr:substrate-binding domain-containing protein [Candidatus Dependentiae bacterium]